MELGFDGFDWDAGNSTKCRSHGVSTAEIEAIFRGEPRVAPDLVHSADEDRLIAIGRNREERALFIAFTIRERDGRRLIRPITARYMHAREIRRYEATGS
jgi:uncharacterized DUF497 family protein